MIDERLEPVKALGEQLRAKISSKFQTSTFLAGFAFAILGIQISVLWEWQPSQIPLLLFIPIALLVAATILYINAIIRLDELTMPKRFWEKIADIEETKIPEHAYYLTEEELLALKERMVFYWNGLTLKATYLTAVSLILMLLPTPLMQLPTNPSNTLARWLIFVGTAILSLAAYLYIKWLDKQVKDNKEKKFGVLKRPVD